MQHLQFFLLSPLLSSLPLHLQVFPGGNPGDFHPEEEGAWEWQLGEEGGREGGKQAADSIRALAALSLFLLNGIDIRKGGECSPGGESSLEK